MSKTIRVGLFGVSLKSVNYGVSALALTQISMLKRIEQIYKYDIEYWIFSDDSIVSVDYVKKLLGIERLEAKYIVRIKTGLSGLFKLKRDIKRCSFIIDLTYGDSFSDIYGLKFFYLYSLPKLLAIWTKKCLILGPQTIGPFYCKNAERVSSYILKKANYIAARDTISLNYAKSLSGRQDIILTSDLAMSLPYETEFYNNIVPDKTNIGLNVSLLMWQKDSSNSNLNVTLSYKDLIMRLLLELQIKQVIVHLIVHVYDKKEYTEYTLAQELHDKFDNTILAPQFEDPIDAKNYMSQLDIFIGARMHATIGAFSSGVPVIPISYSRKFEGLYGSLGYDHCIDCSKETVNSAIKKICDKIDSAEKLEHNRIESYIVAKKRNEDYYHILEKIVAQL